MECDTPQILPYMRVKKTAVHAWVQSLPILSNFRDSPDGTDERQTGRTAAKQPRAN